MNYGDIELAATVDFLFGTSVSAVPTTLVGGTLAVYAAGNATEMTAGVTLSVDYDGKTGVHRCQVAATGANGFAEATSYTIVLTAGTVGGVTVAPAVLAVFSITNRSVAAVPTGAENAAALLDLANGIETGLTLREALRLVVAAEAGLLSGAGTTTIVIRNAVVNDKNRIVATVDSNGNRSNIVLDLT